MRLTKAGNPSGPFQITWTEDYLSICDGGPGIGKGSGYLSGEYELTAQIVFTCFSMEDPPGFEINFDYDPSSNTITDDYGNKWSSGGPANP